jgi:hypothetical protein
MDFPGYYLLSVAETISVFLRWVVSLYVNQFEKNNNNIVECTPDIFITNCISKLRFSWQ